MKCHQYVSCSLHFIPKKKWIMIFSVRFYVRIYVYLPLGCRVVLDSDSFRDAENSNGQSWGPFYLFLWPTSVSLKRLPKMSKDNRRPLKIHHSTRRVMSTIFLLSSTSCNAILVNDLYRLPRCTSPYKHP